MGIVYSASNWAFRRTLWMFATHTVEGLENIPADGPILVIANHQSNIDPPLLAASLPRRLKFLAKDGVFFTPIGRNFLTAYGAFPVRKGIGDKRAYSWAVRELRAGSAVTIFPEGTRNPGGLRRAEPGIASIALKSGAPILPVALTGTERLGSILRVFNPTGHLVVRIGRPFVPASDIEVRNREQTARLVDEIMGRVAALLPESFRGCYAEAADAGWHLTRDLVLPERHAQEPAAVVSGSG